MVLIKCKMYRKSITVTLNPKTTLVKRDKSYWIGSETLTPFFSEKDQHECSYFNFVTFTFGGGVAQLTINL